MCCVTCGGELVLAGLVARLEDLAQFHASFVELRLRGADRHAEHLRNLFVFVTFNIVQHETLSDILAEVASAHCRARSDPSTGIEFGFSVPLTICTGVSPSSVVRLELHAAFAEVHQALVDRQPVQPGRKR